MKPASLPWAGEVGRESRDVGCPVFMPDLKSNSPANLAGSPSSPLLRCTWSLCGELGGQPRFRQIVTIGNRYVTGRFETQAHSGYGAAAFTFIEAQAAVVKPEDALSQRQAEADAPGAVGDEEVEQPGWIALAQPAASVGHRHLDVSAVHG